jgi:hypothetical protein
LRLGQLIGDLANPNGFEQSQAAQQAFLALDTLVEFG